MRGASDDIEMGCRGEQVRGAGDRAQESKRRVEVRWMDADALESSASSSNKTK